MNSKDIIEIGMVVIVLIGIAVINADRKRLNRGIVGRRVTQFFVVLLTLPLGVILTLEGKFSSDAIAALFGAVLGYVLSPLAKESEN